MAFKYPTQILNPTFSNPVLGRAWKRAWGRKAYAVAWGFVLPNNFMFSFNGIGTTLYGKSDVDKSDGSYLATKWFIIFLLPIFPLGTYRVRRGETHGNIIPPGVSTQYQMIRAPFNWRQVLMTYLVVWGSAVFLLFILFHIS